MSTHSGESGILETSGDISQNNSCITNDPDEINLSLSLILEKNHFPANNVLIQFKH